MLMVYIRFEIGKFNGKAANKMKKSKTVPSIFILGDCPGLRRTFVKHK